MGERETKNEDAVVLTHVIYRDPKSLGAELDDFENCQSEWLKNARDSGQFTDGLIGKLTMQTLDDEAPPKLVVLFDQDTARFVGFFVAYTDQCSGKPTLRVPMVNWNKKIDEATEDAILDDIDDYAGANECPNVLIHVLPFQSRLRRALDRHDAVEAGRVYKVGCYKPLRHAQVLGIDDRVVRGDK